MKAKTGKSIYLKKHTIANLNNSEMNGAKGGTERYTCSGCPTGVSECICVMSVDNSCACIPTL